MEAIAGLAFVIVFPVLGVMILVWFRQLSKLFAYLRENHPQEYKEIGEPTLIMNNSPRNNIALLRFIQGKRPSDLGDEHLEKWCRFLTRFFYVCVGLFFSLIIVMVATANVAS